MDSTPSTPTPGIYAKVIEDSTNGFGNRLTTFELRMHRFVLAEFNTHRVFSRNSASSRAIPLAKQIDRIRDEPAVPVSWPMEQSGMQGGDELDEDTRDRAINVWLRAATSAMRDASALGRLGVHKSVANRILEPFMWHTVVFTTTSMQNFLALRDNPMAQPEIRAAAEHVRAAYAASKPRELWKGEWHVPYIQEDERDDMPTHTQIEVSAARVARTSYLTQNGVRDFEQDRTLYARLTAAWPMHASPLEHVATPEPKNVQTVVVESHGVYAGRKTLVLPSYGNFIGWHQHRFDVEIDRDYQAFS